MTNTRWILSLAVLTAVLLMPLWTFGIDEPEEAREEPESEIFAGESEGVEWDEVRRIVADAVAAVPWAQLQDEVQVEVERAMAEVDWQGIQAEVERAMAEVDWEEIQAEVDEAMAEVDFEAIELEVREAMEEVEAIDVEAIRLEVLEALEKVAGELERTGIY